jgi:hypothetical protein
LAQQWLSGVAGNTATTTDKIQPIVAPRPGHTALVLAAGVANGRYREHRIWHRSIRGKTIHTEEISHVDVEADPNDPDHQIKKTTLRLKPTTTLTLLSADGNAWWKWMAMMHSCSSSPTIAKRWQNT